MVRQKDIAQNRKDFLLHFARGAGIAAFGGVMWNGHLNNAVNAPLMLRPPGAVEEKEFLKTCIKCGLCEEACPYDAIQLGTPGDDTVLGTPGMTLRENPCRLCEEIPCTNACPSDALSSTAVQTDGNWDVEKISIGTAVIDTENCLAHWGIRCDACYRACPLLDKAIRLQYQINERTEKHAYFLPQVDAEYCTGCGLCENACITNKAAIFVLPDEVALGKVDKHYLRDWISEDESRIDPNTKMKSLPTELNNQTVENYLNSEDWLND